MTSGNGSGIVLIIEDNRARATTLATQLEREGHRVSVEMTGTDGMEVARALPPGLTILDLKLPTMTDFTVLQLLRHEDRQIPVLVLTSLTESEETRPSRCGAGTQERLVEPCHIRETFAGLCEMLKRAAAGIAAVRPATQVRDLTIDFAAREVKRDAAVVPLPPKAFDLLVALVHHRGEVVSRAQLLRDVWGYAAGRRSRTVDTHVGTLRERLGNDQRPYRYIVTVPRAGYRFVAEE
jgi:DNA-binding response OmpR family regulator